jgi:superfamily II DNA or RNA helicase
VPELTAQGYLSPYKLYAPANVDLSGVHKQMGDYARGELGAVMDKPKITGDAVQHYKKYCNGKRAIVFCVSIEHSKHVVEQFQKEGINAAHVDGETPDEERTASVEQFAKGNIQVLSNVELFGEGYDCPSLECAILLRPTQSLGLYCQQIGRALRPFEGKTSAIILDHVGNCERFGLPDTDRVWSLEGRDKSKGDYEAPVRICPACFGAQRPGPDACIFCGSLFPAKPRTIESVAGNLQEVTAAQLALRLKWKREQGMKQSFADLVALGKARGYKNAYAWAAMVLKGRQAKKLKQSA